eukprot:5008008-Prorocentrum_lima.AAC.1
MTSSLVGSEMCIRDRCWAEWGRRLWWAVGSGGGNNRPSMTPRKAPWAKPVSYTHLTLPTICSV